MPEDPWATPTEVTDLDIAFPANALDIMPEWKWAEAELNKLPDEGAKWIDFQRRWFYQGLPHTAGFHLKDGVDGHLAFRHLKVIQGSYAPKHEHKEVAVAYLASRWFDDVVYEGAQ